MSKHELYTAHVKAARYAEVANKNRHDPLDVRPYTSGRLAFNEPDGIDEVDQSRLNPAMRVALWMMLAGAVAGAGYIDGTRPVSAQSDTVPDTTNTIPASLKGEEDYYTLVGAGDIAKCGEIGSAQTASVILREIEARKGISITVFTLGDNAYENGTIDDYKNCYDGTWGQFKEYTKIVTFGNHDYGNSTTPDSVPQGTLDYFKPTLDIPPKGYYSYTVGNWTVAVLNFQCTPAGGCGKESPQGQWLTNLLDTTAPECLIGTSHYSLFSSGQDGGISRVKPLFEILYEHGAELFLGAHDHSVEGFLPQDPEGNFDVNGIEVHVNGAGGGGHGSDPQPTRARNSLAFNNTDYGVTRLNLYPDRYELDFLSVKENGFTFHSEGACADDLPMYTALLPIIKK